MYCTCIHVHTWAIHAYTYTHGLYMHTRVCMYCSLCVYVYATVYVYACTVHAYTCMHVWSMCVRVYTCMDVCYMCLRVCMYGTYVKILNGMEMVKKILKFFPHTNRQKSRQRGAGVRGQRISKGGLMPPPLAFPHEFKGHAIIAPRKGGGLGTRLQFLYIHH